MAAGELDGRLFKALKKDFLCLFRTVVVQAMKVRYPDNGLD